MASERHCLKIPFLIGQRDDAIIGNSCADNPAWEVPCAPLDLDAVLCSAGVVPPTVFVPAAMEDAVCEAVALYAPSVKVVVVL